MDLSLIIPTYNEKENIQIKKNLKENFEKIFECDKNWGLSAIYKYS
jgi:hypothetical protein